MANPADEALVAESAPNIAAPAVVKVEDTALSFRAEVYFLGGFRV